MTELCKWTQYSVRLSWLMDWFWSYQHGFNDKCIIKTHIERNRNNLIEDCLCVVLDLHIKFVYYLQYHLQYIRNGVVLLSLSVILPDPFRWILWKLFVLSLRAVRLGRIKQLRSGRSCSCAGCLAVVSRNERGQHPPYCVQREKYNIKCIVKRQNLL